MLTISEKSEADVQGVEARALRKEKKAVMLSLVENAAFAPLIVHWGRIGGVFTSEVSASRHSDLFVCLPLISFAYYSGPCERPIVYRGGGCVQERLE